MAFLLTSLETASQDEMEEREKDNNGLAADLSSSLEEEARKKRIWALVSLCIAVLSVWAVSAQWKDFSFAAFIEDLRQADWRWLLPAVLSMLDFIVFEALALRSACRALQYPTTFSAACGYAAADKIGRAHV